MLQQQIETGRILTHFVEYSSEGMSAVLGQNELYEAARSHVSDIKKKEERLKVIKQKLQGDELLLAAEGKQEAVKMVCQRLRADVELTANSIAQRKAAFCDACKSSHTTWQK